MSVPGSRSRPHVLAVDDSTVVRESLPLLLHRLDVVAVHPTVEALLRAERPADLLVLDLHLVNERQPAVRQGLAAVRAAVRAGHRVCVYTQEERRFVLAACMAAGAAGVVSKAASLAEAEEAFLEVAAGGVAVPPAVASLMEVLVRRDCVTILGERQRQVLAGRARGLSYGQLARELYLAETTLRGYWAEVTATVTRYLACTTPADIERSLGLAPGDLLDFWPEPDPVPDPVPDPAPAGWWRLRGAGSP